MSDIAPINIVSGGVGADRIEPVSRHASQRYEAQGPSDRAARGTDRPSDRVDISDRARLLAQLAALPEVRQELVDRVRSEIAAGVYETDEKLDGAIMNLAEDLDPGPVDS
jgi:flagellar biosynthesis anti-sigma factor FlgM